jgi:hypothetical protein
MGMAAPTSRHYVAVLLLSIHTGDYGAARPSPAGPARSRRRAAEVGKRPQPPVPTSRSSASVHMSGGDKMPAPLDGRRRRLRPHRLRRARAREQRHPPPAGHLYLLCRSAGSPPPSTPLLQPARASDRPVIQNGAIRNNHWAYRVSS